jgi:hypothetical protein
VILSQCCACRSTACACSLSRLFYRGRHGQESEEGKEDHEGSHQEGGKEDFQEKEVVVPTTERLPPPGRNPDAKRNLSQRIWRVLCGRSVARQGKTRPDPCAGSCCIKVRFFVSAPGKGHDLLLARRIDAARPRRACGTVHESLVRECGRPTIAIHLKPWRERNRTCRTTFSRRRAVFLIGATRDDPQSGIRQWPLQGPRLVPGRTQPHVAFFVGRQDYRHGFGMNRLHDHPPRGGEKVANKVGSGIGFDLVQRSPLNSVQMPRRTGGGRRSLRTARHLSCPSLSHSA